MVLIIMMATMQAVSLQPSSGACFAKVEDTGTITEDNDTDDGFADDDNDPSCW